MVDFKRRKFDVAATVERLEYDPNRTAFIALIKYADGELAYILAPQRLAAGDKVIAGKKRRREAGQRHAARRDAGRHDRPQRRDEARQGRSDRPFGRHLRQLVGRDQGMASCASTRANSAWSTLDLHGDGRRGVEPGPHEHSIGKAGRNRWKGKRRDNRGVAMNPVDHPHGGGEGRTSGGRHPVTPWGKPTKGKKTRNNKRRTSSSSAPSREEEEVTMARSVWKGPFVDGYLLKKAEKPRASGGRNESSRSGAAAPRSCRSSSA
jgi:large subunit ribosomal protein L2